MSCFFARRLQPHSISSGQVIHCHPFHFWVSLFHASFDKSLSKDFLGQLPGKSWEYCDASLLAFFQAVTPETPPGSWHHLFEQNKCRGWCRKWVRCLRQFASIWNLGPTWGFMLKHLVQRNAHERSHGLIIHGNSILYWYGVLRMCRSSSSYFVPLAVAPLFFSSGRSTGFWMTRHACNVDCVCWKAGCGRFTISSSLYSLLHHLKIRRCHFHIFGLAWTFWSVRLRRPATHKWVVCSMI